MLHVPEDLAQQHHDALAAIPVPMSPTCARSLINQAAREHFRAEVVRKSARSARHTTARRGDTPRCDRLTRRALRAEALAADLVAEVR